MSRVEVEWVDGMRTEAGVANGFFIGRKRSTKLTAEGYIYSPEVRRVVAFGSDGALLGEGAGLKFGPMGAPDEND